MIGLTIVGIMLVVTNWSVDFAGLVPVALLISFGRGRRVRSIADLPRLDRSVVVSGLITALLLGESIALAIATAAR